MSKFKNLGPQEIKEILDKKNGARLIDVREKWEYNIASIENSELMPISIFMGFLDKLNIDDELIIYCHKGIRSASVCNFLADKGYKNLINLKGGIDAWAIEVDPSIPRY